MACKASESLKRRKIQVLSPNWPKQALKLVVLVACSTAVIFQLSECIMKLSYPPVSTHTELEMNESIAYPAVTICRNPPYKPDVLKKYNLGSDIRYTSEWKNFPFNTTSLSTFWKEATYSQAESIKQFGLSKSPNNVDITSSMQFINGQCYTLRSRISTQESGMLAGYSIALEHTTSTAYHRPWNIYIHQPSDVFTENHLQTTGIQELVTLPVSEEMQVKVSVQQLKRVDHPKNPCYNDRTYSATRCEEQCRWNALSQTVKCSVPWMPGTGLPECNNYEDTYTIMVKYLSFDAYPVCKKLCLRACHTSHFAAYIVNRNPADLPKRFSQLWVYHSSKLVSSVQEHWDYDLSRFVADAGGSLGFLLGVSVLSLVSLLAKIFRTLISCGKQGSKDTLDFGDDDTRSVSSISNGSIHSKVTLVAAHKY